MSPHRSSEPTIVETSDTESFSSEQGKTKGQNEEREVEEVSLDTLFEELAKESKHMSGITEEEDDEEFNKIQESINNLPKITSKLEENIDKGAAKQKTAHVDVVRINDPIIVRTKKTSEDAQDSGSKWFNMRQPEMTPEIKRDLLIVKHKSALDPKRHYKKDKWEVPKFFQMGTIVESKADFYASRMKRKDRGNTLVEEVLNDGDTNKYFKRKYTEIQDAKRSGKKGHYKKVKQMRQRF